MYKDSCFVNSIITETLYTTEFVKKWGFCYISFLAPASSISVCHNTRVQNGVMDSLWYTLRYNGSNLS